MLSDRFIHIHIPRTGGQLIRGVLFEQVKNLDFLIKDSHQTLLEYRSILKEKHPGVICPPSFCVVRNPFEWYVSRYFFRQLKKLSSGKQIYIESFGNTVEGFRKHMYEIDKHVRSKTKISTGIRIWNMYNTFSEFYYNMTYPGADYIARMESYVKDISRILKKIAPDLFPDVSAKLKNKFNSSEHNSFKEYYNKELENMVKNWDSKFIEEFKYKI